MVSEEALYFAVEVVLPMEMTDPVPRVRALEVILLESWSVPPFTVVAPV